MSERLVPLENNTRCSLLPTFLTLVLPLAALSQKTAQNSSLLYALIARQDHYQVQ